MEGDGLVADNLMGKIFDSVYWLWKFPSLLMVVMFKEVCPSPPSLPVGTHCFFLMCPNHPVFISILQISYFVTFTCVFVYITS